MRTPLLVFFFAMQLALQAQPGLFHRVYQANNVTTLFEDAWPTSDGGSIACGTNSSVNSGDHLLVKLDAAGQVQWSHTYGTTLGLEDLLVVREDIGGGYYGCGFGLGSSFNGSIDLLRADASGNMLWHKTYEQTNFSFGNMSVRQMLSGKYVIAASFSNPMLNLYGMSLSCADSNGNLLWSKLISDSATGSAKFVDLALTSDGSSVVLGQLGQPGAISLVLIKTDSLGNTSWMRPHLVDGRPSGIDLTNDGGFIVTGNYMPVSGLYDLYLGKFDSAGTAVWMKSYHDGSNGTANTKSFDYNVKQIEQGYVISGPINVASTGNSHLFMAGFNAQGNPLWAKYYTAMATVPSKESRAYPFGNDLLIAHSATQINQALEYGVVLRTDNVGSVSCNEATFTLTPTIVSSTTIPHALSVAQGPDTIGTAYVDAPFTIQHSDHCALNVGMNEAEEIDAFGLYPNPAGNEAFIRVPENAQGKISVRVYDALGKLLVSVEKNAAEKTIALDLSDLASGLYHVQVSAGERIFAKRLLRF